MPSELRRTVATLLFYGVANRIHTRIRLGYQLRHRLARSICPEVGDPVRIAPGVLLSRGLRIGDRAGVGGGTKFLGNGEIVLGEGLKMGPDCLFITNDHPVPRSREVTFDDLSGVTKRISVGKDVFMGARVVVLPGTTIGDGVAVGAGSVVSGNVPPYSTIAGNPAKVIRTRDEGHTGPAAPADGR